MAIRGCATIALALAAGIPVSFQAAAQDAVADFYRGKQVNIYAGSSAGGGYDTYARLLGRHIGTFETPGRSGVAPLALKS